jgi:hypothetical protein
MAAGAAVSPRTVPDMRGNPVVVDGALPSPKTVTAMHARPDIGQRFQVPSVRLDIPLGALDETGVPLCCLSSGEAMVGLIEGAVAEHGEEDVAAAPREGDEGLVVAFALGDLAVVVGA